MECPFCDAEKEISYRLLHQTKHFYLIPDLGAFVEGYLLIVSKEHYENLASLPKSWIPELIKIEKKAIEFLKKTYNTRVIEYEHGPCVITKKGGGSCIDHFHLAIVATDINLHTKITKRLGQGKKIKTFQELCDLYLNGRLTSYILYKDKKNNITIWLEPCVISQYIRRLLYEGHHHECYNWRLFPHPENIIKNLKRWKKYNS